MLAGVLAAVCVSAITIPLSGYISDRIGRKKTYIIGCVTMGVFGFVYFGLIDTGSSVLIFIAMMLSLIPHDIQYGPQAALIAESFTPRPRYSGASIAGSITAGGPGSVSRHSSGPRSPVRSDARRDPLWEFAAVPARSPAALAREQPDLEALERIFVAIVFGMTNACSGTHESNRHLESVVRSLIHLGDYATLQFQPIPLRDPANNFAVSGGLHLYRKATPKRYLRERLNPLLRLCMMATARLRFLLAPRKSFDPRFACWLRHMSF